jgi:hypothetical protein
MRSSGQSLGVPNQHGHDPPPSVVADCSDGSFVAKDNPPELVEHLEGPRFQGGQRALDLEPGPFERLL